MTFNGQRENLSEFNVCVGGSSINAWLYVFELWDINKILFSNMVFESICVNSKVVIRGRQ